MERGRKLESNALAVLMGNVSRLVEEGLSWPQIQERVSTHYRSRSALRAAWVKYCGAMTARQSPVLEALMAKVEAVLREEPEVCWAELWARLPNDYASPRSMATALHLYRRRRGQAPIRLSSKGRSSSAEAALQRRIQERRADYRTLSRDTPAEGFAKLTQPKRQRRVLSAPSLRVAEAIGRQAPEAIEGWKPDEVSPQRTQRAQR